MPQRSVAISILVWVLTCGLARAALPVALDGQPLPSLAPVLERVAPAVVNIHTRTRVRVDHPLANDPFFRRFLGLPRERISQSLGSGVVVDAKQGLVLTNNHVIEGADDIQVTLHDGRTLSGELLGTDVETDVAVLRVAAEDLVQLELADSDALRVGDFVVAVGNPFGLGQTVTSGIVSALGRRGLRGLHYQNFIQTDASINPGNSGGALVNLRGELVGVNTAIFSPSGGNVGIGFAIPSNIAASVMSDLVTFGAVRRGRLGISLQDMTIELARALGLDKTAGALITRVNSGSAAESAGLEVGDVIVALGEHAVANSASLRNAEGLARVGQDLVVRYYRDGRSREAVVRLTTALAGYLAGDQLHPRLAGAQLVEAASDGDAGGIFLEEVQRTSAAWRVGLRPGDVILGVNNLAVANMDALRFALANSGRSAFLTIRRDARRFVVRLG